MKAATVFAVLIATVVAVGTVTVRTASAQADSVCVTGGAVASGQHRADLGLRDAVVDKVRAQGQRQAELVGGPFD